MNTYAAVNEGLSSLLALHHAPVAVSFLDEDRRADAAAAAPAGCCFWAPAEHHTIVTRRADHAGCSVGSYVHGLLPLDEAEKASDVAALVASAWVTPVDLASVPVLDRSPETIVYEPLASAERADVVLFRVDPRALMALQGAVPEMTLTPKPQCQIVARAAAGEVAVSPGCAVSRVRTGLPEGELTVAVPAAQLDDIIARLRVSVRADGAVAQYAAAYFGADDPTAPRRHSTR